MKVNLLIKSIIQCVDQLPSDQLSVAKVAGKIGYSRWQIQRTFSAVFNISLSEFIQLYKLDQSAKELVQSKNSILLIALNNGFSEQSSFSRAFKSKFKITPKQYRLNQVYENHPLINFEYNESWSSSMIVNVQKKSEFKIAGVTTQFNPLGSENSNSFEKIPAIWKEFCKVETVSATQKYGVITESDVTQEGVNYFAGSQSMLINEKLSVCVVRAGLYAIIAHIGFIDELEQTMDGFFVNWLPESEYKMRDCEMVEMYDDRFDAKSKTSYFEIWVPLEFK